MLNRTLLHPAWRLAEEIFRPGAAAADQGDICGPVRRHIGLLAQAGYFGLAIRPEDGGLGADEATRHEYTEILSSTCGVTAFTQQQLQVGIRFVAAARNEGARRRHLPTLARGEALCGVAISHLRRPGPPLLRAERVPGGYRLDGTVPWVTAWELLDCFVLGAAVMPQGEHVFVLVNTERDRTALRPGSPLPLSVMNASGTVQVIVRDLFVSDEDVLSVCPADDLRRAEHREITSHTALPLGCARGAAAYLRALAQERDSEELSRTAMALTWEIDQCRREALTWNCECAGHPAYGTYAVRARAGALVLALRAAQAAVAAAGSGAHGRDAVPQRLMREAQFYTTVVQTPEIQAATLDLLLSPLFGQ